MKRLQGLIKNNVAYELDQSIALSRFSLQIRNIHDRTPLSKISFIRTASLNVTIMDSFSVLGAEHPRVGNGIKRLEAGRYLSSRRFDIILMQKNLHVISSIEGLRLRRRIIFTNMHVI